MSEKDLLLWLCNLFEEPPGRLRSETSRDDVAAWDSLGVLTLMAALDAEFNVRLSGEQANAMACVGDILSIVRGHGKLS